MNMVYDSASSGFEQVPAESSFWNGTDSVVYVHQSNGLTIGKSGYLYIYASNETPNIDVIFDNLQVTHFKGPLVEATHYYPFGLTMARISSEAFKPNYPSNRKKFNGIEYSSDFELNTYDAFYRSLDPQIGRWWQIDPKPNECVSLYSGMQNNPLKFMDPLGDTT